MHLGVSPSAVNPANTPRPSCTFQSAILTSLYSDSSGPAIRILPKTDAELRLWLISEASDNLPSDKKVTGVFVGVSEWAEHLRVG